MPSNKALTQLAKPACSQGQINRLSNAASWQHTRAGLPTKGGFKICPESSSHYLGQQGSEAPPVHAIFTASPYPFPLTPFIPSRPKLRPWGGGGDTILPWQHNMGVSVDSKRVCHVTDRTVPENKTCDYPRHQRGASFLLAFS